MSRRLIIPSVVALVALAIVLRLLPSKEAISNKIKIGAPHGAGGLIVHQLVNKKKCDDAGIRRKLEFYSMGDCCCSSKSEWALSTDLLDLAIMCPDAARELLRKDKRYEIVGPCLANSDILVVKSDKEPRKIGITQGRDYQKDIAKNTYGGSVEISPMLSASLPYAYEAHLVDGVVIDALKGLFLDGRRFSSASNQSDQITYVLVARKSFQTDSRYEEFLRLFEKSAKELNNLDILAAAVCEYQEREFTRREAEEWNQLKIKFVFTIPD